MHLHRRVRIQLVVFTVVALVAAMIMTFGYMRLPTLLFGIGRYLVTVELDHTGGLYERANITYQGTKVGQVKSVRLTYTGAEAVLSLDRGQPIPADSMAQVHSQSAIGEIFVALVPAGPHSAQSPPLRDGDVIPAARSFVPPDINSLLDATNRGLAAIPKDSLRTVIDESYTALGGLGQEISRIVRGSTELAVDAQEHLVDLTNVIDNAKPLLDSQGDTAEDIAAWAANLSRVAQQLKTSDPAVEGLLRHGPRAATEARQLLERVRPTVPVIMANLVTLGEVAVTYQPAIEQILVLLPQGTANMQGTLIGNHNTGKSGSYLSFNLNINLPPPCTTGFLPIQQQRVPTFEDAPPRTADDVYCRIAQDNPIVAVRGARNYPCITRPGKRAPTAKMCESDENYVPLNDGFNWKGDPNATLSGQAIPQPPPGMPGSTAAPGSYAPAPIAVAEYDPATGTYIGSDGQIYTQSNLAHNAPKEQTWQTMLLPPNGN